MTEVSEKLMELTKDQEAFLEECNLEFSERYTDADLEYKKIYDLGIPSPPIVYPWSVHTGRRFNNNRSGSSRNDYRNRNNNHREESQRRPGSSSWYGETSDYRDQNDRHRNYQQEHNVARQNYNRPQHYRPY